MLMGCESIIVLPLEVELDFTSGIINTCRDIEVTIKALCGCETSNIPEYMLTICGGLGCEVFWKWYF